jgi:hypothetical protein
MPTPINLDRGVSIRIVPASVSGPAAGMQVCMYKDDPGLYYAPNGVSISPEWAKKAGFDVEADLKERDRRARRSEALAKIDKEFDVMPEGEIVQDGEDFQIVHMGHGWFDVIDADGGRANSGRLRREAAVEFVKALRDGKAHKELMNG